MLIGITGRIGSGKDSVASIVQELYPELNWQIKGFADKLRKVASLLTGIPAEDMKRQEVKEMVLGEEWWYYHLGYTDNKVSYFEAQKGGYGKMDFDDLQKPTVRSLLQKLGTNGVRDNIHMDAWVNALMCDYRPHIERAFSADRIQAYHCSDCRSCHKGFTGYKRQSVCNECIAAGYKEWPNWLITDCRFPNELEAITSRGGIRIRIVRPDNPYTQSNHPSETSLDDVELLTIINDGNLEQLRIKVKEVFDPIVDRIRASGSC